MVANNSRLTLHLCWITGRGVALAYASAMQREAGAQRRRELLSRITGWLRPSQVRETCMERTGA